MAVASHSSRRQPITVKQAARVASFPASDSSSTGSSLASDLDGFSSYSRSTAPTSSHSPKSLRRKGNFESMPGVSLPEASAASVNTYDSLASAEEGEELYDSSSDDNNDYEEDLADEEDDDDGKYGGPPAPSVRDDNIPAVLPTYRAPISDPSVRPSDPQAFGRLFPSLDRLSIHHDDLTPDGNMSLRVDTVVPSSSRHRGPVTVQLFHLRMHDLARRDFSLRRYCRDSGREVCHSKRAYVKRKQQKQQQSRPPAAALGRSMSYALRTAKAPFQRSSNASSIFRRPSTSGGGSISSRTSDGSLRGDNDLHHTDDDASTSSVRTPRLVPTESIKLEFTNYARVDVTRRRKGGYGFEWWGHRYAWRRVVDRNNLGGGGAASFHLVRDGRRGDVVAHIVPETRSPNQVLADEVAGGWVPPCHMWISDPSVLDAKTDVADVIVATGLIALVDDSIKQRWQIKKKPRRLSISDAEPRKLMRGLFQRRLSNHSPRQSGHPFRGSKLSEAVVAY